MSKTIEEMLGYDSPGTPLKPRTAPYVREETFIDRLIGNRQTPKEKALWHSQEARKILERVK